MALTVGELTGFITIDDRAVTPALRRAEGALRASGRRMGSDADDSGQTAGQRLGDGVVRGADGRLRNARGQFVAAGRRSGDAVGDGLTDGTTAGAGDAAAAGESGLSKLKMAAAGIGIAAGAVLMDGITQALEQGQITGKLAAQLGQTPAEAQRYGKIAGQLYANAVTQDFQGAADVISATMRAGLLPPDATNAQIESIAAKVSDLSSTFELDLGQSANAVGQIMKNGLAPNAQVALDIMTKGMQAMGPRADDLADTFNEYSTIFRSMGLSAQQATGLLSQGMQAGARDTDVVADAIKEFQIRATDGSKASADGFAALGLNAEKMTAQISKGGTDASDGLQVVLDKLRGIDDPVKRNAAAVGLFGTKAEDLGQALFALDPSKAAGDLGKVGGAADKMGNALRDNAGVAVEQFKRQAMQKLVDFLGTQVIPAFQKFAAFLSEHKGEVMVVAGVIAGVLIPVLITLGVQSLIAGGRMAAAWFMALGPVGWVILTIAAIALIVWQNWDKIKAWTLAAWDWVWGKIKWVGNAIWQFFLNWTLPGLIIKHWDKIKSGATTAWNAIIGWLKKVPGWIYQAFLNFTPIGLMIKHWNSMKDGAISKGNALLSWVRGFPGAIGRGIGSLGSLLYDKGRNVVQGLWSGIQSMGGWIKSQLISWAKASIPAPIAKALGIASPSKVTKAQGRWIARGLVDGLTGSSKQVKSAATKLADIVRDSLKPGKKRSNALARIGADSKKLQKLASQEEKLAGRLKTASKKLADLIKARDKVAADVKKGVLDSANITTQDTGGWPQTAESILAGLKSDRAAAEKFAKDLAQLRKKGVRSDLIAQIAQAGVEQGSAAAAALANATPGQIKQINKEQAALVTAAGNAGTTAGNAMYGAGIAAAQGLVKGLKSQQSAIERQMEKIAKSMSKAIKKALGIKSPSKVMAQVGAYTAEGLRQGIESGRGAVNRSMESLVSTPRPGETGWAASARRGAAGQRVVLELRSSGRAEDDYLIERMRRGVRTKSGGDVELALTGRRA
ncbi:phage tail tape measure protein [Streptomyces sp. NPDC091292]|uniref:phage tail tape measure protein n=1 Tax=Streptomyces sp. NPDC091292 TaxID=3365991 RepID=UPI00382F3605